MEAHPPSVACCLALGERTVASLQAEVSTASSRLQNLTHRLNRLSCSLSPAERKSAGGRGPTAVPTCAECAGIRSQGRGGTHDAWELQKENHHPACRRTWRGSQGGVEADGPPRRESCEGGGASCPGTSRDHHTQIKMRMRRNDLVEIPGPHPGPSTFAALGLHCPPREETSAGRAAMKMQQGGCQSEVRAKVECKSVINEGEDDYGGEDEMDACISQAASRRQSQKLIHSWGRIAKVSKLLGGAAERRETARKRQVLDLFGWVADYQVGKLNCALTPPVTFQVRLHILLKRKMYTRAGRRPACRQEEKEARGIPAYASLGNAGPETFKGEVLVASQSRKTAKRSGSHFLCGSHSHGARGETAADHVDQDDLLQPVETALEKARVLSEQTSAMPVLPSRRDADHGRRTRTMEEAPPTSV